MKKGTNKKLYKKMTAGFLVLAILMTGNLILPENAEAAEGGGEAIAVQDSVIYVKNEELAEAQQFDKAYGVQDSAPTKEGYFFGGWYDYDESTKAATPITTKNQSINYRKYAKFVPAYVLSVKAQNHSNTKDDPDKTDDSTNMRVISSVDCLNYQKVGFEIYYGETKVGEQETKNVYSNIVVTKKNEDETTTTTSYAPTALFGKASNKFISVNLLQLDESLWSEDLYAIPYWITFDGVKVYGLGKYVYVQDGIDGWISIPVNLHTASAVAAGMLQVEYDSSILEYKEYRAGRVFEEVTAYAKEGDNVVKCVGNVNDISNNATADSMYITLRFKVDSNYDLGAQDKFLTFKMSGIDFCNVNEQSVSMNVMNIQY